MLPLYLQLTDFMLHGESCIDFTKLSPATAIIGMEDSNLKNSIAVGKTTIFHAIRYALYNAKPSTNINKVIRDGARKSEVIFDFQMSDGNIYRIHRVRTKTTQSVYFKIKDGDDWVDLTDRTNSLTDQKIQDVIKINQDTFENSSYFQQSEQFNLASATPAKRKEIIREMLHLEEWSIFEKKAKIIRDDYDKKLSIVKNTIDNIGDPEADCKLLSTESTEILSNLSIKNSNIEETSKILDCKKLELEELKRNLSLEYPQLLKKLKDEESYLSKLQSNLKILSLDKQKHTSTLQLLNTKVNTVNNEISTKEELLQQTKDSLPEEPDNNLYMSISDSLMRLFCSIKENETLYKTISKPLPSDDFCPTCSTTLDHLQRQKLLTEKQIRIDSISLDIEASKEKYSELEISKKDIENKVKNYRNIKTKIVSLTDEISYKKNSLVSDSESITQKQKLIDSLDQEISSKETNISQCKTSIASLSNLINAAEKSSNDHVISNINNEIKTLSSKLSALREEHSSLIYNSGKVKNNLEIRKNDLQKLNQATIEKKDLEYNYNIYKAASVIFSAQGIPTMIIHSVLDSLQCETNKVLEILIPGIQVQFLIEKEKSSDDTLDMRYILNGKECEFTDLSGGQQECVTIALKFAVCVINRNRCGADIKMLLLDEIDKSLDQSTINSFFNVLKIWSKNIKILVITHNQQLKELFQSFILVNKVNGVSSAEVVN
jgi:exonuclease SbcC